MAGTGTETKETRHRNRHGRGTYIVSPPVEGPMTPRAREVLGVPGLTCLAGSWQYVQQPSYRRRAPERVIADEHNRQAGIGKRERDAFLWLHYARWKVAQVRQCKMDVRCARDLRYWLGEVELAMSGAFLCNIGLAVKVMARLPFPPSSDSEEWSAARWALLKSILHFDASAGYRFSTYAYPIIRQRILLEFRQRNRMRLCTCVRDGKGGSLMDEVPAPDGTSRDALDLGEQVHAMRCALCGEHLKPFEKEIVCRRYGIDCQPETLSAIGDSHGLSKERIRQIEVVALKKIRAILT